MTTQLSVPRTATGLEHLVVATDGGAGSRAALRWIADHVGARAARISVVSVQHEARPSAEEALDTAGVVLRTLVPDCTVTTRLLQGDPVTAIVDASVGASLVVVGARADGGPLTAPRVPARVAERAAVPVVVVPHDWTPSAGAIVVGSSADSASAAATDAAAVLAESQGRRLVLCHAWELPLTGDIAPTSGGGEAIPPRQRAALEQVAGAVRVAHPGLDVVAEVREGSAAHTLAGLAADAALLVVGRRRGTAAMRVLLGSVSRHLVAAPPCPVMVIPQPPAGLGVAPDIDDEDL